MGDFAGVCALAHSNALKQGFFSPSSIKKNYTRRWFILTPEFLLYYVDDAGAEPLGVIPLSTYDRCEAFQQRAKYALKICSSSSPGIREYFLFGATATERDEWIQAIQDAQKQLTDVSSKYGKGKARVETSIYLKINEAKWKDDEPRDTYCTIMEGNLQKARTPTCYDKAKPIYSQEYELDINPDNNYLTVQVRQMSKKAGTATIMGQHQLQISSLPERGIEEGWKKLLPAQEQTQVSGQLLVQLGLNEKGLRVTVLAGKDLMATDNTGTSDPFVAITYGDQKHKTSIVKKNLNPSWKNQHFTFDVFDRSHALVLEVYDGLNKDGSSDFMGVCRCNWRFMDGKVNGSEFWMDLKDRDSVAEEKGEEVGEIRLSYQKRRTVILPDKCYDSLVALLLADNMAMTRKLASVCSQKEKPVAEALVKAFECKNCAVHYVKNITSTEISSTSTHTVLFRGNTVCTKSLDMYMRLVGTAYLQNILKMVIENIARDSKKKSCELDPNRLGESNPAKLEKIRKKNLRNLTANLDLIFDAITKSVVKPNNVCPATFRNIFTEIRKLTKEKFPNEDTCLYTSASGFIFLRFFCPAILTPTAFGLLKEHPAPHFARDLMLIVKTLQNLANLVVFGKKEEYMICCNEWINKNMDRMKNFIDTLSTISNEPIDEVPYKRNTQFGREMSRLAFHLYDSMDQLVEKFGADDPHVNQLTQLLKELDSQTSEIDGSESLLSLSQSLLKKSLVDQNSVTIPLVVDADNTETSVPELNIELSISETSSNADQNNPQSTWRKSREVEYFGHETDDNNTSGGGLSNSMKRGRRVSLGYEREQLHIALAEKAQEREWAPVGDTDKATGAAVGAGDAPIDANGWIPGEQEYVEVPQQTHACEPVQENLLGQGPGSVGQGRVHGGGGGGGGGGAQGLGLSQRGRMGQGLMTAQRGGMMGQGQAPMYRHPHQGPGRGGMVQAGGAPAASLRASGGPRMGGGTGRGGPPPSERVAGVSIVEREVGQLGNEVDWSGAQHATLAQDQQQQQNQIQHPPQGFGNNQGNGWQGQGHGLQGQPPYGMMQGQGRGVRGGPQLAGAQQGRGGGFHQGSGQQQHMVHQQMGQQQQQTSQQQMGQQQMGPQQVGRGGGRMQAGRGGLAMSAKKMGMHPQQQPHEPPQVLQPQ